MAFYYRLEVEENKYTNKYFDFYVTVDKPYEDSEYSYEIDKSTPLSVCEIREVYVDKYAGSLLGRTYYNKVRKLYNFPIIVQKIDDDKAEDMVTGYIYKMNTHSETGCDFKYGKRLSDKEVATYLNLLSKPDIDRYAKKLAAFIKNVNTLKKGFDDEVTVDINNTKSIIEDFKKTKRTRINQNGELEDVNNRPKKPIASDKPRILNRSNRPKRRQ